MDFPTAGQVGLAGQVTSSLDDAGLTQLRRHKIGFVFQFFQLLPALTALENVELPLLLSGAKNSEDTARERLRWVGLEEKSRALPYQLSGGQMQRVAIAGRWYTTRRFWLRTSLPEISTPPAAILFCD